MSHTVTNYFRVLGVQPGSNLDVIKRAYRSKLKEAHPDLSKQNQNLRVQEVVEAYRALMKPEIRALHEKIFQSESQFNFRDFLKEQKDQISFMRLIIWDLFYGFEDEACILYLKAPSELDFRKILDREDFMDVSFVLAEELFNRKEYRISYKLCRELVEMEFQKPYFKHFFPELNELFLHSFDNLIHNKELEDPFYELEQIMEMNFKAHDLLVWLKRTILLYIDRNQLERARFYYQEALRMNYQPSQLKEFDKVLFIERLRRK